ncbi:hypothetical protein PENVUL_c008G03157 [Penicillium vulpinum]|uniref:HORMA domain-containing protein n=1 Tax=Penicillium vulpinum TaxID=29845 RepID=A0A1V6S4Z6_9EURO|nr:hypothetical protein PENVUL_c008G03157 [Penicillium vulpinum]
MSRSKKTVDLEIASESGALQPKIQADTIHRFPVIMNPTNSYGIIGAKLGVSEDYATHDHRITFTYAMPSASGFCEQIASTSAITTPIFLNGKGKDNFARNRSEYVPIWAIERHISDEADKLLDLLENDIFDALLRGILRAVQFTVIADKNSPKKVLESYTFTFENSGERGTADCLTNGPRMDFVSPHEDRTSAAWEYTSSTNRNAPDLTTSFWKRTKRFYGSVDSGFHTVGLRVNSLISTSPGGEAHFPSVEEASADAVLRSDEVGIPTPAQMPLDVVGEIYLSTDESTASDSDYRRMEDLIFFKREDVDFSQSTAHKMAQSWTDPAVDPADESKTKRPTRPERSKRSRIPFNEPEAEAYATNPISREGIFLSRTRRETREVLSPTVYIRRLQNAGSKPIVTTRTVDYVKNRQDATKKLDERDKDNNESPPSSGMTEYGIKDGRRHRCECNTWRFTLKKSIQCANCKDHQHTLCYGYYSAKDHRIPDIHYCYSCLIGYDFDSNLMEELIKLIRMRRIIPDLSFASTMLPLNWQLAYELNCSDDEARATVHNLRKLGILRSCDFKGYEIPPPKPYPMIRSHWSRPGTPILARLPTKPTEERGSFDPRQKPKPWERVRSNPSANVNFFGGQAPNSISKRRLDLQDEGFEDGIVSTRRAKKTKLR